MDQEQAQLLERQSSKQRHERSDFNLLPLLDIFLY
jgi:biopolymer transport protein ExbD